MYHNMYTYVRDMEACLVYIGVRVMVHSVTLARIDIVPEDGLTVTETCQRFYEILAF